MVSAETRPPGVTIFLSSTRSGSSTVSVACGESLLAVADSFFVNTLAVLVILATVGGSVGRVCVACTSTTTSQLAVPPGAVDPARHRTVLGEKTWQLGSLSDGTKVRC